MDQIFEFIWVAMKETPLWVYVVFGLIVFIGVKSSKYHTTPLWKMFITPIVFGYLMLDTLMQYIRFDVQVIGLLVVFGGVGVTLGYLQLRRAVIEVDKKNKLVRLPGTWSVLVLGLIIFATKYYFGYSLSLDPELLENTTYEIIYLLLSGICTGMILGKVVSLLVKFKSQATVDLKSSLGK